MENLSVKVDGQAVRSEEDAHVDITFEAEGMERGKDVPSCPNRLRFRKALKAVERLTQMQARIRSPLRKTA